jgi:hypothetical protein
VSQVSLIESPTDRYVTLAELRGYGLTYQDVRRRCPRAVELTDASGDPFWERRLLQELLRAEDDWTPDPPPGYTWVKNPGGGYDAVPLPRVGGVV